MSNETHEPGHLNPNLVMHPDGRARCPWPGADPLYVHYHDTDWGVPEYDDRALFEKLILDGFQAGLSWITILRKRENFRAAFDGFEPAVIAGYGPEKREALMADAGIVRNRRKIDATIGNARATVALRPDGGLAELVWSFRPERTPTPSTYAEVPTRSAESEALAKELRRRGFAFVGPTTMFALMEAVGIVDTHLLGSHRRGTSGVWT
jgi:DNA-3-methyladenine glycosylase I